MAETLPRHFIYAVIVFMIVVGGGVAILSEFQGNDDTYADMGRYQEFNKSFNKQKNITDAVGDVRGRIVSADTDPGLFGVLNALISSSWTTLIQLFNIFGFMGEALDNVSVFFGVPPWITGLVVLLITVLIAFAIFSAVFQREI